MSPSDAGVGSAAFSSQTTGSFGRGSQPNFWSKLAYPHSKKRSARSNDCHEERRPFAKGSTTSIKYHRPILG